MTYDLNVGFNEQYYLDNNPDVAEAVNQGVFESAYDHFVMFGAAENRNPNQGFDSNYYLTNNPDVAQAVADGLFSSAYEHFILYGLSEGREPNPPIVNVETETIYVQGPTVFVPETDNIVFSQGQIDVGGTENYQGTELVVGSGIYADGKTIVTNVSDGYELSMGFHYRQGDQLIGVDEGNGTVRISADAGIQTGGVNGAPADAANRSAVSFDYTLNTGVNSIGEALGSDKELKLLIDVNPAAGVADFIEVTFEEVAPDFWVGFDPNGVPVIGDAVAEPHLIQESSNFGFGFLSSAIVGGVGPAGAGDLPAGEYEVYAQIVKTVGGVETVEAQVGGIFDLV